MRTNTDHIEDMYYAEKRRVRDAEEERDKIKARLEFHQAAHARAEAERDRLRAEVAALRAAWPDATDDGPEYFPHMACGTILKDEEGWSVNSVIGVFPTRDEAIDAELKRRESK
jgi:hypothetical protein